LSNVREPTVGLRVSKTSRERLPQNWKYRPDLVGYQM